MPSPRRLSVVARNMAANVKCLWKPAQSGKTRTMQELIRADDGVKNHLNILICSNNRLLVAQTNARMTNDLYDDARSESSSVDEDVPSDDRVIGGVYSWMSGTKKTNISVEALAWKICNEEVSMIVCCAHKVRFRMLKDLLTKLKSSPFFKKQVNVWIDEADVSVEKWSGEFDFSSMVREVTLVSATFDSVFEYYDRIRVMPFPDTHPSCYVGIKDCDLKPFDVDVRGAAAYMDAVLKAYPEMLKSGTKLFIPGDIERSTHDAIAKYLTARGVIVLVLNGTEKAFRFPDGRTLNIELSMDEDSPDELSEVLATKYIEYNMKSCAFAVTGQLCLGRGITFQSRSFTFDYAIIPTIRDAAAAYQCVARVLGNIRTFSPWTPTVYMGTALLDRVKRQERIAINLAKLVHEKEWRDVGALEVGLAAGDENPGVSGSRAKYDDDDYEAVWSSVFNSVEELKASKLTSGRMPTPGEDGFYKNANGGKGPMSLDQLNSLKAGKKTTNMRLPLEKVGETTKRTYPYYEDPSDKTTLRFVVRTLTRIK